MLSLTILSDLINSQKEGRYLIDSIIVETNSLLVKHRIFFYLDWDFILNINLFE